MNSRATSSWEASNEDLQIIRVCGGGGSYRPWRDRDRAGRAVVPGFQGVIATAHAVVGRPLTPVSVAGVARRTARRCANGAYEC